MPATYKLSIRYKNRSVLHTGLLKFYREGSYKDMKNLRKIWLESEFIIITEHSLRKVEKKNESTN